MRETLDMREALLLLPASLRCHDKMHTLAGDGPGTRRQGQWHVRETRMHYITVHMIVRVCACVRVWVLAFLHVIAGTFCRT
jgi:hypothetical protein